MLRSRSESQYAGFITGIFCTEPASLMFFNTLLEYFGLFKEPLRKLGKGEAFETIHKGRLP
jgi:hypothetical protein